MINTGYANAGTGDKGHAYCEETCLLLSELAHCAPSEVLPFSTGVIGQTFPMEPFEEGLPLALDDLSEHHWGRAAEGIMTTDTVPKVASRRIELDGDTITITGPVGLTGNVIEFRAVGVNPYHFTLAPTDGSLDGAEPTIGPWTFTS